MSHSNAYEKRRSTAMITLYSGPREFELDCPAGEKNPSLFIRDLPRYAIDYTEFRIFMQRAQLRELRDLLTAADLGDEYDVEYVAACLAWEAIGVS